MSLSVQLLSVDAVDSHSCIVVYSENSRFIFDVGEGMQRLAVEHRVRLGKIAAIFVTNLSPDRICGLPGFFLTSVDAGARDLSLIGPGSLQTFIDTTKYFMQLPSDFIHYIQNFEVLKKDGISIYGSFFQQKNTLISIDSTHACYLIQSSELPGKFDVQKASQLKVPKGPLFGQLKNGKTIVLEDGRVIEPSQVVGPSQPSQFCAIICSIPDDDEGLMVEIMECEMLKRFRGNGDSESLNFLDCIIHLSPSETVNNPKYQDWLYSFGTKTQHIFSGKGLNNGNSSSFASTKHCNKFHKLAPNLFPKLCLKSNNNTIKLNGNNSTVNRVSGNALLSYVFQPAKRKGLVEPEIENIENLVQEFWEEIHLYAGFSDSLENLQNIKQKILSNENNTVDETKTIKAFNKEFCFYGSASEEGQVLRYFRQVSLSFLGTACAVPSKYRSVSGIALNIPTFQSAILIDVGEGTWLQLIRQNVAFLLEQEGFGCTNRREEREEEVKVGLAESVKAVWVSHPHADHHLGLISVITQRKIILQRHYSKGSSTGSKGIDPLLVVAPPSVLAFLKDYAMNVDNEIESAYFPVSCRLFDPFDSCTYEDVYWRDEEQEEGSEYRSLVSEKRRKSWQAGYDIRQPELKRTRTDPEEDVLKRVLKENKRTCVGFNCQCEGGFCMEIGTLKTDSPTKVQMDVTLDAIDRINISATDEIKCETDIEINETVKDKYFLKYEDRRKLSNKFMMKQQENLQKAKKILKEIGIISLKNVQVIHCSQSYGLSLELSRKSQEQDQIEHSTREGEILLEKEFKPLKIVYSGDTRPCDRLIKLGQGAHILIHEATFEDDKMEEAVNRRHSTISEALQVGTSMNCFRTILTHFSQRYPGLPQCTNPIHEFKPTQIKSIFPSTTQFGETEKGESPIELVSIPPIFAADFMRVSMEDMLWAPASSEVFLKAFPAAETNDDVE